MTNGAGSSLSLAQQGDLVETLLLHCTMRGGEFAAETHLTITRNEAEELLMLASRLRRIAPFEAEIKRLVIRG
ncbi:hypothetical protein [Mesorhizobium sp.]|uniref:hypothetical protein n=1 Tax=Mesorhizobium sp. TaxID=1871066 RepID=UPI001208E192|nr:hypothetical protein [Mesorhizobium sp.]TIN82134.1 MAG: hypothetical protein E5X97_31445 [Mesorhizobium sp.]